MKDYKILDACCGGRQFWFDKEHSNTIYADFRLMPPKVVGHGIHERIRRCVPDIVHDFRKMPFADETFNIVFFDPPHLFVGENSFTAQSYGRLEKKTWKSDLSKGFDECFRVLKLDGVLIFKWSEHDIPTSEVLKLSKQKPLVGHHSGKAHMTHWFTFMKI